MFLVMPFADTRFGQYDPIPGRIVNMLYAFALNSPTPVWYAEFQIA